MSYIEKICFVNCRFKSSFSIYLLSDYLDENCNGTLYVSNTGPLLLNLTRHAHYQPSMECQVTITGLEHHRLMVYFRSIDIEHEGDCAYDWVELDDGDTRADAYIAGMFSYISDFLT